MLDGILGQIGLGDKGGDLMSMVGQHIQGMGGAQGVVNKAQEHGLQEHAESWVGTGENKPISGDQASNLLGNDFVKGAAAKFGLDPNMVSGAIAAALPMIMDKLTPKGQVEQGGGGPDIMGTIGGLMSGGGANLGGIGGMLGGLMGGDKD